MRPIFPILFALLLALGCNLTIQAQTKPAAKPTKPAAAATTETAATDANVVYRIKIGAFKSPDLKKFEALKPEKGSVFTEDAGNGLTRVLIGDYKTEAIANKALEDVKKAGYPDAFVTKRKLDAKTTTATKPTDTPKGKDEAKPTDEKPADTDKYLIQLGLIKDADFTQYGNLTDLGTIYSEKNGDAFRVSLGVFTGRDAANKVLETVKKRGYATAFPRKRDAPKKNDK
jgi:cell division septation protein DedD